MSSKTWTFDKDALKKIWNSMTEEEKAPYSGFKHYYQQMNKFANSFLKENLK